MTFAKARAMSSKELTIHIALFGLENVYCIVSVISDKISVISDKISVDEYCSETARKKEKAHPFVHEGCAFRCLDFVVNSVASKICTHVHAVQPISMLE